MNFLVAPALARNIRRTLGMRVLLILWLAFWPHESARAQNALHEGTPDTLQPKRIAPSNPIVLDEQDAMDIAARFVLALALKTGRPIDKFSRKLNVIADDEHLPLARNVRVLVDTVYAMDARASVAANKATVDDLVASFNQFERI